MSSLASLPAEALAVIVEGAGIDALCALWHCGDSFLQSKLSSASGIRQISDLRENGTFSYLPKAFIANFPFITLLSNHSLEQTNEIDQLSNLLSLPRLQSLSLTMKRSKTTVKDRSRNLPPDVVPLASIIHTMSLQYPNIQSLHLNGLSFPNLPKTLDLLPSSLTSLCLISGPTRFYVDEDDLMLLPLTLQNLHFWLKECRYRWISRLSLLESLTLLGLEVWTDDMSLTEGSCISPSLRNLSISERGVYLSITPSLARNPKFGSFGLLFPSLTDLALDIRYTIIGWQYLGNLNRLKTHANVAAEFPRKVTEMSLVAGTGFDGIFDDWAVNLPPDLRVLNVVGDWIWSSTMNFGFALLPSHLTTLSLPFAMDQYYGTASQAFYDILPRTLKSLEIVISHIFPSMSPTQLLGQFKDHPHLMNLFGGLKGQYPPFRPQNHICKPSPMIPQSQLGAIPQNGPNAAIVLPADHSALQYIHIRFREETLPSFPFARFDQAILVQEGYPVYEGLDGKPCGWVDVYTAAKLGRLDILKKLFSIQPWFAASISPAKHDIMWLWQGIVEVAPLEMVIWLEDRGFCFGDTPATLMREPLWFCALITGRIDILKAILSRRPRILASKEMLMQYIHISIWYSQLPVAQWLWSMLMENYHHKPQNAERTYFAPILEEGRMISGLFPHPTKIFEECQSSNWINSAKLRLDDEAVEWLLTVAKEIQNDILDPELLMLLSNADSSE